MEYKKDYSRAKKAFDNAPKPVTLDKRLNDISFHTYKLTLALDGLNENINQLRDEINEQTDR